MSSHNRTNRESQATVQDTQTIVCESQFVMEEIVCHWNKEKSSESGW